MTIAQLITSSFGNWVTGASYLTVNIYFCWRFSQSRSKVSKSPFECLIPTAMKSSTMKNSEWWRIYLVRLLKLTSTRWVWTPIRLISFLPRESLVGSQRCVKSPYYILFSTHCKWKLYAYKISTSESYLEKNLVLAGG